MNNMPAGKFPDCTTISNSELLTHSWGLENQMDGKGKGLRQRTKSKSCSATPKKLSGKIFGILCAPNFVFWRNNNTKCASILRLLLDIFEVNKDLEIGGQHNVY